jgi:hypothetical protein
MSRNPALRALDCADEVGVRVPGQWAKQATQHCRRNLGCGPLGVWAERYLAFLPDAPSHNRPQRNTGHPVRFDWVRVGKARYQQSRWLSRQGSYVGMRRATACVSRSRSCVHPAILGLLRSSSLVAFRPTASARKRGEGDRVPQAPWDQCERRAPHITSFRGRREVDCRARRGRRVRGVDES